MRKCWKMNSRGRFAFSRKREGRKKSSPNRYTILYLYSELWDLAFNSFAAFSFFICVLWFSLSFCTLFCFGLAAWSSFIVVRLYMLRVAAFLNWLVWQFMLAAHISWFHVAAAFGCSFGVGSRFGLLSEIVSIDFCWLTMWCCHLFRGLLFAVFKFGSSCWFVPDDGSLWHCSLWTTLTQQASCRFQSSFCVKACSLLWWAAKPFEPRFILFTFSLGCRVLILADGYVVHAFGLAAVAALRLERVTCTATLACDASFLYLFEYLECG